MWDNYVCIHLPSRRRSYLVISKSHIQSITAYASHPPKEHQSNTRYLKQKAEARLTITKLNVPARSRRVCEAKKFEERVVIKQTLGVSYPQQNTKSALLPSAGDRSAAHRSCLSVPEIKIECELQLGVVL
jgi:hypothetical protein